MLCGHSCKAFWSAMFVMILKWFNNSHLPWFSLTTNQTKQFNPFLVETATCEFTIAALHHYSCFASMTLHYFIDFIKCALEFCKVWIKLSSRHSKTSRIYFLINSHCIASYMHSEATMMPIDIHSQQEPLICTLTQQKSLAVAQVVVSFMLSLLGYTICAWEAVNVSKSWHE